MNHWKMVLRGVGNQDFQGSTALFFIKTSNETKSCLHHLRPNTRPSCDFFTRALADLRVPQLLRNLYVCGFKNLFLFFRTRVPSQLLCINRGAQPEVRTNAIFGPQ